SQIVLDGKESNFKNAGELAEAANDARKAHEAFLDGVIDAIDIAEMKAALSNRIVFPEFVELDEATKVEKAEAVLTKLEELQDQDPATNFKTLAEIKAAAGL